MVGGADRKLLKLGSKFGEVRVIMAVYSGVDVVRH